MRILFITSTLVGDVILGSGALKWLFDQYPDARFTIVCGRTPANLFQVMPRLDHIIPITKRKWRLHWLDIWKQCKATQWDLIVDLRNTIITRFLHADQKIINWQWDNMDHRVVLYASVLKLNSIPDPFLWIAPNALSETAQRLPKNKFILAICPTASTMAKRWPIERFIQLISALIKPEGMLVQASVLVIGAPDERDYITPLLEAIPAHQLIDVVGCELQLAAAYLKSSNFFIGNDSGLMHMAAAVGTPNLGLFGPDSLPEKFRPWGSHSSYIHKIRTINQTTASLDKDTNEAMKMIAVDEVIEVVENLIASTSVSKTPPI